MGGPFGCFSAGKERREHTASQLRFLEEQNLELASALNEWQGLVKQLQGEQAALKADNAEVLSALHRQERVAEQQVSVALICVCTWVMGCSEEGGREGSRAICALRLRKPKRLTHSPSSRPLMPRPQTQPLQRSSRRHVHSATRSSCCGRPQSRSVASWTTSSRRSSARCVHVGSLVGESVCSCVL